MESANTVAQKPAGTTMPVAALSLVHAAAGAAAVALLALSLEAPLSPPQAARTNSDSAATAERSLTDEDECTNERAGGDMRGQSRGEWCRKDIHVRCKNGARPIVSSDGVERWAQRGRSPSSFCRIVAPPLQRLHALFERRKCVVVRRGCARRARCRCR